MIKTKILSENKSERSVIVKNISTKNLVLSALFLALGVLLPQVFHAFGGKEVGSLFSPMHIPVLLCGLIVGPVMGTYIGLLTPILSFFITGMPPMAPPILPMMIFELVTYGLVSGLLFNKFKLNIFLSLLVSIVMGRVIYGIAMFVVIYLFRIQFPPGTTILASMISGIPGIILQFIFIPTIMKVLSSYQNKSKPRI